MANLIAKLGFIGDTHLNSKNYGAHRDYAAESLEYFHKITEKTSELGVTHLIGTGDFSFSRFISLEYRLEIEKELQEQNRLTNNNRFELKGNHDHAGYGLTERDYYVSKGLLKESTNFDIGNVKFTLVDYGKEADTIPNIVDDENHVNIIVCHNYFKFRDTKLPNFGSAIDLDEYTNWFGVDYMVCGHVHKDMEFDGIMVKDQLQHNVHVNYLGCMMRPAYREGLMDEKGKILVISVFDDGNIDIDTEYIDLWPLDKSFNIEAKAEEKAKKEEKVSRVDISDIVKQLDSHDRNVGSPEDIIQGLTNIDDKYKNKAIELLHSV